MILALNLRLRLFVFAVALAGTCSPICKGADTIAQILEQLAATLPEQKVKPNEREDEDDRGIFGKVKDIFG